VNRDEINAFKESLTISSRKRDRSERRVQKLTGSKEIAETLSHCHELVTGICADLAVDPFFKVPLVMRHAHEMTRLLSNDRAMARGLVKYLQNTKMLSECLMSDCYLSKPVRKRIEDSFFSEPWNSASGTVV
jgi:hypothetical protein